jgi:hypothetical protein
MKMIVLALSLAVPIPAMAQGFGPQQVMTATATGAASVYATDLDGDGDADVLSASCGAAPFSDSTSAVFPGWTGPGRPKTCPHGIRNCAPTPHFSLSVTLRVLYPRSVIRLLRERPSLAVALIR